MFKKHWRILVIGLVVLIVLGTGIVTYAWYSIQNNHVDITVKESISIDNPTVTLEMSPNSIRLLNYTITNSGDAPVDVKYNISVGPAGCQKYIKVDDYANPSPITIAAASTAPLVLSVAATHDIEPGAYTIDISVMR